MNTTRRTKVTITALAAAALLVLGSCTMSTQGAAPEDSAISVPPDTGTGPDQQPADRNSSDVPAGSTGQADVEADTEMLRESGSWAAGVDLCSSLAQGPWKEVGYGSDPVSLVEQGTLPAGLDPGLNEEPDEINRWTEAGEYHDPSTLEDPGAITAAMDAAGFDAGAEALWHNGHEEATITAVRFQDAEAAQDVLTALATDYCTRADSARVLADGTGMDIIRDSGATRVLSVLDDTVISVWACSCISRRTDDGVGDWHDELRALIEQPAPDSTSS